MEATVLEQLTQLLQDKQLGNGDAFMEYRISVGFYAHVPSYWQEMYDDACYHPHRTIFLGETEAQARNALNDDLYVYLDHHDVKEENPK